MEKFVLLSSLTLAFCFSKSFARWQTPVATESFSSKRVINASPLRQPFAMLMEPDDSLWVTGRRGYVTRVNTSNGGKTQLLNIAGLVKFTTSGSGASLGISQDGMFGIALHPELNRARVKKLNTSGTAAALTPGATGSDSVVQHFKFSGALNRYRDIALGSDGRRSRRYRPWPYLEFIHLGATLAIKNTPVRPSVQGDVKVYLTRYHQY